MAVSKTYYVTFAQKGGKVQEKEADNHRYDREAKQSGTGKAPERKERQKDTSGKVLSSLL